MYLRRYTQTRTPELAPGGLKSRLAAVAHVTEWVALSRRLCWCAQRWQQSVIASHTKFQMQRTCICEDTRKPEPPSWLLGPQIEVGSRCARDGVGTIVAPALLACSRVAAVCNSAAHEVSDAAHMYLRRYTQTRTPELAPGGPKSRLAAVAHVTEGVTLSRRLCWRAHGWQQSIIVPHTKFQMQRTCICEEKKRGILERIH